MKILFIADSVENLHPLGDSTLAMLREAKRRRHDLFWATGVDVEYRIDSLFVFAANVLSCSAVQVPELAPAKMERIDAMDMVFIRKDPPFDANYVKLCWLLALAEKKVWMINPPSVLLRYHEKLIPLEALAHGFLQQDDLIPTHIGSAREARDFVREHGIERVVTKPFLGYAGNGVALVDGKAFQAGNAGPGVDSDLVVQPFLPEIMTRGDRRVIFVDGRVVAHFVRLPKDGSFIANLAQGGAAVSRPLTPREGESLQRLGKFLKHAGIAFAGADLIGHWVSEVNITSPTGLRSLEKLEGKDYADEIMDFAERSAVARSR
jgi:glutathione synthase